jgi:hypothetical protein
MKPTLKKETIITGFFVVIFRFFVLSFAFGFSDMFVVVFFLIMSWIGRFCFRLVFCFCFQDI